MVVVRFVKVRTRNWPHVAPRLLAFDAELKGELAASQIDIIGCGEVFTILEVGLTSQAARTGNARAGGRVVVARKIRAGYLAGFIETVLDDGTQIEFARLLRSEGAREDAQIVQLPFEETWVAQIAANEEGAGILIIGRGGAATNESAITVDCLFF